MHQFTDFTEQSYNMKAFLCTIIAVVGAVRAGTSGPYQTPTTSYKTSPPYTPKYQAPMGYGQEKAKYGKTGYEPAYNPPAKYAYDYEVKAESPAPYGGYGDSYANPAPVDFGAHESREGDYTKGSYHVYLPDGRTQTVSYYVDGYSGYVADVKYDGYAKAYAPAPYGGMTSYQKPAMKQATTYETYPPTPMKPYQEAYNTYGDNAYTAEHDGSYKAQEQTYSQPQYDKPYNTQQYPTAPASEPYNNPPYGPY